MIMTGPMRRLLATAGLASSLILSAAPALAAQKDIDFLKDYLGSWRGRGTLTGANVETVACKLTMSNGNSDKINYSGRCVLAGSNLSISGTIAYIDDKQRYEAIMTSNASFTGVAVGHKQGSGVVFNLQERDKDEGKELAISAVISLLNGGVDVNFHVVDVASGDVIDARVPFIR
ncbi:MAG TPA: hypothetical protein VGM83_07970 [Devosiaceae bacterium]|jgi:hypothetical protein